MLSNRCKSSLSDKIIWTFFQPVAISVQLNGCTTCTLTKYSEKKLDRKHRRMLTVLFQNKSRNSLPENVSFTETYFPSHKLFQMNNIRHVQLDKQGQTLDSWTRTCQCWPASKILHPSIRTLNAVRKTCQERLPERERERESR